jgi:phosphoglycolate phosphatase
MIIYFIDLDGTIEDSKLDMIEHVQTLRKKLNLKNLQNHDIEPFVNKGMDELYKNCFSDFISLSSENYMIVKHNYEELYYNHPCIKTTCYENIPNALKILSKKGFVIVVTNKPEKISKKLLKELNVMDYITDVMGGDSCSECKPSPLPLEIASKKLNYNPSQDTAFMIGDSLGDIKTAKAFGAKSVWCSWGYLDKLPNNEIPDYILNEPHQLCLL